MKKETSCGTIVIAQNKVLLIKQKAGFWGFPKGHMEVGESEMETAIRETKEETNLDVVIASKKQFSLSYLANDNIDKTVVYFLVKPLNHHVVKQETEVSEIAWIDIDSVEERLTFSNLKSLWRKILKEIEK